VDFSLYCLIYVEANIQHTTPVLHMLVHTIKTVLSHYTHCVAKLFTLHQSGAKGCCADCPIMPWCIHTCRTHLVYTHHMLLWHAYLASCINMAFTSCAGCRLTLFAIVSHQPHAFTPAGPTC
jgi:hypothetical protein